jgi:hypothetical protein
VALLPRQAQTAEKSVDEGPRLEQVSNGAQERCLGRLACSHGLPTREIGPVGWNQRAGAVRQDQDQTQSTLSVEPTEDFERLPFKRVMWPNDPDESRHLDVGSVSCRSSTRWTTRGCSVSSSIGSVISASSV